MHYVNCNRMGVTEDNKLMPTSRGLVAEFLELSNGLHAPNMGQVISSVQEVKVSTGKNSEPYM